MKNVLSLLTLSLLVSAPAFAGAANVNVQCRAKNGSTIQGNVPGDMEEFQLDVREGAKSARLFSIDNPTNGQVEENATIAVVESLKDGVWTLVAHRKSDAGEVRLYAIPKTVRMKNTSAGYVANLTAQGLMYLPEMNGGTTTATYACSLSYSL